MQFGPFLPPAPNSGPWSFWKTPSRVNVCRKLLRVHKQQLYLVCLFFCATICAEQINGRWKQNIPVPDHGWTRPQENKFSRLWSRRVTAFLAFYSVHTFIQILRSSSTLLSAHTDSLLVFIVPLSINVPALLSTRLLIGQSGIERVGFIAHCWLGDFYCCRTTCKFTWECRSLLQISLAYLRIFISK